MPPEPQYTWVINEPYEITLEDQSILDANPRSSHKDWSNSKFDSIKLRIKRFYAIRQLDTCAYCRTQIEFAGYGEPVEHIVSKDPYYQWMFKPKNLSISCDGCNSNKGTKPILEDACVASIDPPNNSDCYKIIHPHIDIWADHIEIEDEIFVKAIPNTKGEATIEVCGLYRFNLPIKRAKELGWSHLDIYTQAMIRLQNDPLDAQERAGISQMVDELALRLRQLGIDFE
jgi:hypothetical protein